MFVSILVKALYRKGVRLPVCSFARIDGVILEKLEPILYAPAIFIPPGLKAFGIPERQAQIKASQASLLTIACRISLTVHR